MIRLYITFFFCLALLPLIPYADMLAVPATTATVPCGFPQVYQHFLYMFAHANFTHWLINAWSLLVLHNAIKWYRLLIAYIVAVLVSYVIPTSLPLVGLSVITTYFLGYILHIVYHRSKLSFWLTLSLILLGIFLPNIAGWHHLVMVVAGALSFRIEMLVRSILQTLHS